MARRIAGECVLVPIARHGAEVDAIFSLNRTAAFVWDQLDGRATGEDLLGAVVQRFEVEPVVAATDCERLLEQLAGIGAVAVENP